MRALRALVIGGATLAIVAILAFRIPPIRDRLSYRATRVISFLFVDLFTTRGVWAEGRPAPTPKRVAQSAVIGGKLYVFGGFAGATATSSEEVEPRVSVYDPVADAWSRAADMPLDVTHCNAVLVDGTVWIAGGFKGVRPGPPVARR